MFTYFTYFSVRVSIIFLVIWTGLYIKDIINTLVYIIKLINGIFDTDIIKVIYNQVYKSFLFYFLPW